MATRKINLSAATTGDLVGFFETFLMHAVDGKLVGMFSHVEQEIITINGTDTAVATVYIYEDPETLLDPDTSVWQCRKLFSMARLSTGGLWIRAYYGQSIASLVEQSYIDRTIADSSSPSSSALDYAYACDNGFLLHVRLATVSNVEYSATVMCTKGKDYRPYLIFPDANTNSRYPAYVRGIGINVFHYPDNGYATQNYTFLNGNQTVLCTFTGYGNAGEEASYTHYGFRLFMAPNGLRNIEYTVFTHNDETYISDGYWAIKDGDEYD